MLWLRHHRNNILFSAGPHRISHLSNSLNLVINLFKTIFSFASSRSLSLSFRWSRRRDTVLISPYEDINHELIYASAVSFCCFFCALFICRVRVEMGSGKKKSERMATMRWDFEMFAFFIAPSLLWLFLSVPKWFMTDVSIESDLAVLEGNISECFGAPEHLLDIKIRQSASEQDDWSELNRTTTSIQWRVGVSLLNVM